MQNRCHRALALAAVAVVFTGFGSATAAPKWAVPATPKITPAYALTGGSMTAANSGWAVGSKIDQMWAGTVALCWDGKGWRQTPTPAGLALSAVAATSEKTALAVGVGSEKSSLALRWNGSAWTDVSAGLPEHAGLMAMVAVPGAATVWALGDDSGDAQQGFAARLAP